MKADANICSINSLTANMCSWLAGAKPNMRSHPEGAGKGDPVVAVLARQRSAYSHPSSRSSSNQGPPMLAPRHTRALSSCRSGPGVSTITASFGPGTRARRARVSESTYRRRRLLASLVVMALCSAVGLFLGSSKGDTRVGHRSTSTSTSTTTVAASASTSSGSGWVLTGDLAGFYVVRPGDTLWSIARSLRPTGDVRGLVDRLDADRGGRPLRVGERILIPS